MAGTANQIGTSAVTAIFTTVHAPVTYCRSIARNAAARASTMSGAGNQNMLLSTATIVSAIAHPHLRQAK